MKKFLFSSIILIAFALFLPGWWVLCAIPWAIIWLYHIDKSALRYLGIRRFWVWLGGTILILPFLGGGRKVSLFGWDYSLDTLLVSLRMGARGLLTVSALALIRRHIPPQTMVNYFWKLGLKRAAPLIPISLHLLPALMERSKMTYNVWKQRGGWRRKSLRNILLLITSLQLQWVREAEDLAVALALEKRQRTDRSTPAG